MVDQVMVSSYSENKIRGKKNINGEIWAILKNEKSRK